MALLAQERALHVGVGRRIAWTSTSGVGITGRAWNTDSEFFQENNKMDCSMGAPLYCLQQ